MPSEWRLSVVVLIYKNKGDAQSCSNYRGIKLLSHTMKLWERVIECRIRRIVTISVNQFGLCLGGPSLRRFISFDVLWRNIESVVRIFIWCL